jgi:hypothetical protein
LRQAEPAPESLQERAAELAGRIGLRCGPSVWLVPEPISPMIWTLGGPPRLLLPAALWDRLGTNKRDALLVHELAHLRRRDHWVRWLELIVAVVYWWFPVAAWVRRWLHEAEERCCDAWVVAVLPECKRLYAEALLDTVDFLADGPALWSVPLAATGMVSVGEIRDRLASIMAGPTRRSLTTTGAVTVAGLAAVFLPMNLDRPLLGPPPVPRRYAVRVLNPAGIPHEQPRKLNDRGQVLIGAGDAPGRFYLTRPNQPINPETDDLNAICGASFRAVGLNNLGQVVGNIHPGFDRGEFGYPGNRGVLVDGGRVLDLGTVPEDHFVVKRTEPFTEGPGSGLKPTSTPAERAQVRRVTELSNRQTVSGVAINDRGQVVGIASGRWDEERVFLTGPNQPINANAIDLEVYEGARDYGHLDFEMREVIARQVFTGGLRWTSLAINNRGQVIGRYLDFRPGNPIDRWIVPRVDLAGGVHYTAAGLRAFRTAPDCPINPETDELSPLVPLMSDDQVHPVDINIHGQVIG